MIQRLRRLNLVFERHPVYLVTTCTHDRRSLLANEAVWRAVERFGEIGVARGALLGRYVLMPDHVHAFVAFRDDGLGLSDWMKSLKNAVSKVLRERGEMSLHWQKGFMDHMLRSGESYAEKWEYVRRNPVRAGLVSEVEEWKWWGEPVRLVV